MANVNNWDDAIPVLCELREPTRRRAYQAVRQEPPATRAQVAEAVGISPSLAAFHLDKLVEAGLLEAYYARPPGRGGPGGGRPPKWYRPGPLQLEVSIPTRRYDVIGRILAAALDSVAVHDAEVAVTEAAHQAGRQLAAEAPRPPRRRRGWMHALEPLGYQPTNTADGVVFSNCPFAALANDRPSIVCAANVALVRGLLEGAGVRTASVQLRPGAGSCCVLLHEAAA